MRAVRPLCGLSAVVLAGTLSACTAPTTGTAGLKGDSKAIDQTITTLSADATSRNDAHICSADLASSVVSRLKTGSNTCTSVISKQLGQALDYTLTLVSSHAITVTGNTATARVKDTYSGAKNHVDVLRFVREGTAWKLSGIGTGP